MSQPDPDEPTWRYRPVSYWVSAIRDPDDTRWAAVDAVRHLMSPSQSVPFFVEVIENDKCWEARALAAHAIFDIAADAGMRESLDPFMDHVVSALAQALADDSKWVRARAAEAIEALGKKAVAALPMLESAAQADDPELHAAFIEAIQAVQAKS